jgi:2-polyprenyl-3-methyl-5-hydroxy-6-metoxy-1,4-benzoquinol methylase
MTTLSNCPLCNNQIFEPFLNCIDYTVSRETFKIVRCKNCLFTFTSPRPADETIGSYYQSTDYISHTNKAASLIDGIYLRARNYTLNWKLDLITAAAKSSPKNLLDYGCGTGAFMTHCHENQWEVTGVEPSPEARKIAKEANENVLSSVESLKQQKFSIITLWHVLEHVPNLNETLLKLRASLADNGTMFIAVPNHNSWDGKHYDKYWAGYDVPRHLWHFSQTTMTLLLKNNNLKLINTVPMKLDSYYISLLSEKYKTGKTSLAGMVKAFVNGTRSNLAAKSNNDFSSLIYVVKK